MHPRIFTLLFFDLEQTATVWEGKNSLYEIFGQKWTLYWPFPPKVALQLDSSGRENLSTYVAQAK